MLAVILHDSLSRFPIGGREITVMDQKTVFLVLNVAVLPQGGSNGLAFLPGVDKDKTFLSTGVFIDIS